MKPQRVRSGYSSGELARLAGVRADTLRHYERKGALGQPARLPNGYRLYPPDALDRVRVVRAALALGFTLDELADVFAVRGRGGAPCKRVRSLAARKLEEAESRLRDLTTLVDSLRALLADWDTRLARTGNVAPARLLETLGAGSRPLAERTIRKTKGVPQS
jgi:DNA-binding transcriptional MerR regulator